MCDTEGAKPIVHYALLSAVHTLKERCRNLQQHISTLEENNLRRQKSPKTASHKNATLKEISTSTDHLTVTLRAQLERLTLENQQLMCRVEMVNSENLELWRHLKKLATASNQELDDQLKKMSAYCADGQKMHSSACRILNDKILQNNMDDIHQEITSILEVDSDDGPVDSLCTDALMPSENSILNDSLGFYYDDGQDDDEFLYFPEDDLTEDYLNSVKNTKNLLMGHTDHLRFTLSQLEAIVETVRKRNEHRQDSATNTDSNSLHTLKVTSSNDSLHSMNEDDVEIMQQQSRTCPMCNKCFSADVTFDQFEQHVIEHFTDETPHY